MRLGKTFLNVVGRVGAYGGDWRIAFGELECQKRRGCVRASESVVDSRIVYKLMRLRKGICHALWT